ncbi:unnamed protein product [Prunus armeniaca]
MEWLVYCIVLSFGFHSQLLKRLKDYSLHIIMFPRFWTQSDIDYSVKLDNSGSHIVRSEMEWLVYCIVLSNGFHSQLPKRLLPPHYDVPQFVLKWSGWCIALFYPLDFTHNSPKDSSLHIMMFPKFWTQSDIDCSVILDNSVLSNGFHSQFPKRLHPSYYDIPQVLGLTRYRLVRKIGQFKFFYPVDFTLNSPNDSSLPTMMFPKFWTQSDIDWSMKLDNSRSYTFYPLDFTHNSPEDSPLHIMLFPKFWTQSDIDWFVKLDNSGSYVLRSEMEWLVYCIVLSIGFHSQLPKRLLPPYYDVAQFYPLDFTHNSPKDSSRHIMMFPSFWTQSDIDWSLKLDNSGS